MDTKFTYIDILFDIGISHACCMIFPYGWHSVARFGISDLKTSTSCQVKFKIKNNIFLVFVGPKYYKGHTYTKLLSLFTWNSSFTRCLVFYTQHRQAGI